MSLTRGERLRRLRAQKGVDQQQAAAAIGIARPYLSLLERDLKGRHIDHVRGTYERAAAYYGVLPEYLLAETPQQYIAGFVHQLGTGAPASFGERLQTVLAELELRWGDEFTQERVAEAMGTTPVSLRDYLSGAVEVTQTVVARLAELTGAPVEWLVPRPTAMAPVNPAIQRVVETAVANGLDPDELQFLIEAWLVTKKRRPSG